MTLTDLFQVVAIGSIAQYWLHYDKDAGRQKPVFSCLSNADRRGKEVRHAEVVTDTSESSEEKRSWFRDIPNREWPRQQKDADHPRQWPHKEEGINWISP